jgi:hypothetical protein
MILVSGALKPNCRLLEALLRQLHLSEFNLGVGVAIFRLLLQCGCIYT